MKNFLYLLFIGALILCCGCSNQKAPQNNLEVESEGEKDSIIWKDYIATDHTNKMVKIGSNDSGHIVLSIEYQTENLSSIFHTDMYYLSLGYATGVSFIYTTDQPSVILNQMYQLNADSELVIREITEFYEMWQYNSKETEKNVFYSTTCVYNKEINKTTVITITSLIPMNEDEFKSLALTTLKTYDAYNLSLKGEFYEKE